MDEGEPMDAVFVERQLDLANGQEVIVRFFRPVEDNGNFRCTYEIIWPDRERRFYGMGVDGVQALHSAMCNAHADLLTSPEGKNGEIHRLDQETLGLPVAGSLTPEDFK